MTVLTRKRLTLRRRLVLGIVALLAAVTLVIGVLSVVALNGFLTARLDRQLTSATDRSQDAFDGRGSLPDDNLRPPASGFLARSGQSVGTLGAIVNAGEIFNAAVLDSDGRPTPIDSAQLGALLSLAPDSAPVSLDLGTSLGEYRVIARTAPNGDYLVIGLPLNDVKSTVFQLGVLILIIGIVGVSAAAVAGVIIVRSALRPLERVAATATRVSELPLDRGEVALAVRVPEADADPSTEVGAVGSAFNRMLGHVASALEARQASENKVRTFVADASHELRTPLASIRGYAELTRRGNHDLPDDVVHAIGRVESESVRMTALVEDLLLLARLDEHHQLEALDVDLGRMLVDTVSDARAAGPDHTWALDLPDEPVYVSGDASKLHQVVANLLTNARTHTPPGTLVTASLSVNGNRAVIEVADTGPGIDPALVPTIFERFVRGDGSRSRASGSTGLGLAIVSAVVEAHAGRAEVESAPGRTVFRVILARDIG
ncbi:MAG: HAMP domain-containing protein [Salinibacterium sp.]|nr:HAMP domain-containing protein [Salinibacterium sp.]